MKTSQLPRSNSKTQAEREADIVELIARCDERGYPTPQFPLTSWGYKRAQCPLCLADMSPSLYIQHHVRKHRNTPQNASESKKSGDTKRNSVSKYAGAGQIEKTIEGDTWRERAKENHARIVAAYGKNR